MAFRWKTPDFNAPVVDPQGVQAYQQQQAMGNSAQALNAANAMKGYQPNLQPNYRGMAPSQATQAGNAQLAQQNYNQFMQDDASLQGKRQQLEQLKAQLAEIDKQIATVEAGGADEERLSQPNSQKSVIPLSIKALSPVNRAMPKDRSPMPLALTICCLKRTNSLGA